MLWLLGGLIAAALAFLGWAGWQRFGTWRLIRQDDGLILLVAAQSDVPATDRIAWLGEAIARERSGRARSQHVALLEILLAEEFAMNDRKHDAVVLFERHLPQHGAWEKYCSRMEILQKWGLTAWGIGHYATARTALDAALEEAPNEASVLRIRGLVESRLTADLAATTEWFKRALAVSEPEDRAFDEFKIACYLARLRADHGELETATSILGESIARFRGTQPELSRGQRVEVAGIALRHARFLCRLGRIAEARAAFDGADMPEAERGILMEVDAARIELEAAEKDPSATVEKMRALIDEADRRKNLADVGRFTLALAHIEARAGDVSAARASLASARALFEKLETRSCVLRVDDAARRLGVASL